MLALAVVLMLCCAAVVVRACWPDRRRDEPRLGRRPAPVPGRARDPGTDPVGLPVETVYRRHRWSERRPRFQLTERGMRRTGHEVRFCLDCPAERSEAQASTEPGAR